MTPNLTQKKINTCQYQSRLLVGIKKKFAGIATKKILPPKFIPKFEDHEKEVIKLIYEAPDHSVNLYEVDYLLGSVGKSLDSQSKRRSTLMRSINEKYSAITGDNHALIATKRVRGDRRMFHYFLDPKKYEEIKHLV